MDDKRSRPAVERRSGNPSNVSLGSRSDTRPSRDPAPGHQVLDEVRDFCKRFIAFPSESYFVVVPLWVAFAHAIQAFESSPRIAFLSPEPGSGKSRVLEVMSTLVPNPMHAVNATPAALFRSVADGQGAPPTILYDEIDTVFGPRARDNEEVRGFLNAGHRRGAVAYRCVGDGSQQVVTAFPAFSAVALAGLHELPDTIVSRSIIMRMRRRAPSELVEPFRVRVHEPEGHAIRDRLAAWISPLHHELSGSWPTMPEGVADRPADVWEPLLAIADAAGGEWPELARRACQELVLEAQVGESSRGVRLLTDLRRLWRDLDNPVALSTETILEYLHSLEDGPWGDRARGELDARGLAGILRPFGVKSVQVKVAGRSSKGYRRHELVDPWQRYLPEDLDGADGSATGARIHRPSPAPSPTAAVGSELLLRLTCAICYRRIQEPSREMELVCASCWGC